MSCFCLLREKLVSVAECIASIKGFFFSFSFSRGVSLCQASGSKNGPTAGAERMAKHHEENPDTTLLLKAKDTAKQSKNFKRESEIMGKPVSLMLPCSVCMQPQVSASRSLSTIAMIRPSNLFKRLSHAYCFRTKTQST